MNLNLAKTILLNRNKDGSAPKLRLKEPPISFLEAGYDDVDRTVKSEASTVLKTCKLFANLEEPILSELCKFVTTETLMKGETLFKVGDNDDNIFVVSSGALQDASDIFRQYPVELSKAIRMILVYLQTLYIISPYIPLDDPEEKHDCEPINTIGSSSAHEKSTTSGNMKEKEKEKWKKEKENYPDFPRATPGQSYKDIVESVQYEEQVLVSDTYKDDVIDKFTKVLGVDDESRFLKRHLKVQVIGQDRQVIRQGQKLSECALFFILKGHLQATLRPILDKSNGDQPIKDDVVMVLGKGSCIGQMGLLTGMPSFFGISTAPNEGAVVARLSANSFERFMNMYPKALLVVAAEAASRLSGLVTQATFGVDWLQVRAGQSIYRQDDESDSVYIVLNGRVRSVMTSEGGRKEFMDEFGRGESVGELELLTATKRVTSVHAVRDSDLAKLPAPLFELLRQSHPKIAIHFTRKMGIRLMNSFQAPNKRPRKDVDANSTHKNLNTIAVVAISNDVPIRNFCIKLTNALNNIGPALHLTHQSVQSALGQEIFAASHNYKLMSWLAEMEERHRIIVYEADRETTLWTQRCVRQADCILVVGLGESEPRIGTVEHDVEGITNRAQKELVLLHSPDTKPTRTTEWLNLRNWCTTHHHIRCSKDMLTGVETVAYDDIVSPHSDVARLARRLTNTSIGLVLGGGGARGISHLGVIRALREHGIPIDMVGGTSIGAFIGGLYADEVDVDTVYSKAAEFSKGMASMWHKVLDITYPISSIFNGSVFNGGLQDAFEDRQIEDLWLPFFCVTTDLTDSKMKLHHHGSMWRYIRGSMTLAGYLPPLCDPEDGHLLVDGGYTNNLPADIMRDLGAQVIFAVDVSSKSEKDFSNYGDELSGWWLLWKRWNPFATPIKVPDMAEIQSRLAYVSCVRQMEDVLSQEMCEYMRPPIDMYSTLQFGSFKEIEQAGYKYTKGVMGQWGASRHLPAMLKERGVSMMDLQENQ
eukprot:Ihof_evm3s396 gene=Ihof_evmTU3s396